MLPLPLIKDVTTYDPFTIDLVHDPVARDYWIAVFERHLPSLLDHCIESDADSANAKERAEAVREEFWAMLQALRADHQAFDDRVGPISILSICRLREQVMRKHQFADPYALIKIEENKTALKLLPALLTELDAIADDQKRLDTIITGIFAGNLFDLGAAGSYDLFQSGGYDFHATRQKVNRPWLVDHFQAFATRVFNKQYHKAILFVDNAGADVVLGMIPLARELTRYDCRVILTANSCPSLNDITHEVLVELLDDIAMQDDVIRKAMKRGQMSCVPSGNDAPLHDLRYCSEPLCHEATDADLLVIEGMGRALESNYHVQFTCDCLKLAMIKEKHVAEVLGGEVYDVVCRFDKGVS